MSLGFPYKEKEPNFKARKINKKYESRYSEEASIRFETYGHKKMTQTIIRIPYNILGDCNNRNLSFKVFIHNSN
jgi:hypothetical protein